MIISKMFHLEMAHRLSNYDGKCSSLHGHRYEVEVTLEGDYHYESDGMLLDFNILKQIWKRIDDQYDHSTILRDDEENKQLIEILRKMNSRVNLVDFNPTAENMSVMLFTYLSDELREYCKTHTICNYIKVKSVKIFETEGACAEYVGK